MYQGGVSYMSFTPVLLIVLVVRLCFCMFLLPHFDFGKLFLSRVRSRVAVGARYRRVKASAVRLSLRLLRTAKRFLSTISLFGAPTAIVCRADMRHFCWPRLCAVVSRLNQFKLDKHTTTIASSQKKANKLMPLSTDAQEQVAQVPATKLLLPRHVGTIVCCGFSHCFRGVPCRAFACGSTDDRRVSARACGEVPC